jgi:hypothetical protein
MESITIFQPPEKKDFLISKTEKQLLYEKFEKDSYIPSHHYQSFMELDNYDLNEEIRFKSINTTLLSILIKPILKYCTPIIQEIPDNIIKTKTADSFRKNDTNPLIKINKYYNISVVLDYPIKCFVEKNIIKYDKSLVIIPSNTVLSIIGLKIPKKFIKIINETTTNFFKALDRGELIESGKYGLIEFYSNTFTQERFSELVPKNIFKSSMYFKNDIDSKDYITKLLKYIYYINEFYKKNYHIVNTYVSLYDIKKISIKDGYFHKLKYALSNKLKSTDILKTMEHIILDILDPQNTTLSDYKNTFVFNVNNVDIIYNTFKMLGLNSPYSKKIIQYMHINKINKTIINNYNQLKFKKSLEFAKKNSLSLNKFNINDLSKLNDSQRKLIDIEYEKLEKYYNSFKNYTDDFNMVKSLSDAIYDDNKKSIKKILDNISKIIKLPSDIDHSTNYLQNKNKINLVCPHVIAHAQKLLLIYKNNLTKNGEIRKYLINVFSLPYDVDGHFCRICGELLAKTDEDEILKFINGKRVSFMNEIDALKQVIWKEVFIILTSHVKFKDSVNLKKIVNSITDALRDEIAIIELNFIKIRTNTSENTRLLVNVYISIYVFAIVSNMIINNYGKITFSSRKSGGRIFLADAKKIKKQPSIVEKIKKQPSIVEKIKKQPSIVEKIKKQPSIVEKNLVNKEFNDSELISLYIDTITKYNDILYKNIITFVDKTLEYYNITPIDDEISFDKKTTIINDITKLDGDIDKLKSDDEIKKYMINNIMIYRKLFTVLLIQFLIQVFSDIKYNYIDNHYSFVTENDHKGFVYNIIPISNKLKLLETFKTICKTNIYFHNNVFNKNQVTKDFKTIMCKHTNVFTDIFTHMINSNTINLSVIDPIFNSNKLKNYIYTNGINSLSEYSQIICRIKNIIGDKLTQSLTCDDDIIYNIINKFICIFNKSKNKPRNIKLINKGGNLFKTRLNNFLSDVKNKTTVLYKKYTGCVNMSDWDFAIEFDNNCTDRDYYKKCYSDIIYYINNILKCYRNEFVNELVIYYDKALKDVKKFISKSKLDNIINITECLKMDTKTFYSKSYVKNNNFNSFTPNDALNMYKKHTEVIQKLSEYTQQTLFPQEQKKYNTKITNVEIFENSNVDNTINAFDLIRINMRYNVNIKLSDYNSINFNSIAELLDFSIVKVGSNLDKFNKKIPKELKYSCLYYKDLEITSYSTFWFILDIISIYIYKNNYELKYDRLIYSIYLLYYTENDKFNKLFTYQVLDKTIIEWVTKIVSEIEFKQDLDKYTVDINFFNNHNTNKNVKSVDGVSKNITKSRKVTGGLQPPKKNVVQNIINNALQIIIKTKNINIRQLPSLSDASIKATLLKAYKWASKLGINNSKSDKLNNESSFNRTKEEDMRYNNHIYEYLVYVQNMNSYYKTSKIIKKTHINPNIKEVLGHDWDTIHDGFKDNISIYKDAVIPELWNTSELSKYKYESFKNLISYIKSRLYDENTIPMSENLKTHIDKYKFIGDIEHKLFIDQKIKQIRPFNTISLNADLSSSMNDFSKCKIHIEYYYDNNGNPHKFDIYVYQSINAKGVVYGSKKEYTKKDIISWINNSDRKQLKLFESMIIVDERCSICNDLFSNVINKTVEKNRTKQMDIINFFNYYENRCPISELHNFIISSKNKDVICSKCGITPIISTSLNKQFYNKYIKSYEKSINEKNKIARLDMSSIFNKTKKPGIPFKSLLSNKYPAWVNKTESLLRLSKMFKMSYNTIINLGLSTGFVYKLIEKSLINPSTSVTSDNIDTQNIYLHGYYLDIVRGYYLIKNSYLAKFIPFQLKIILDKNKIRDLHKLLPDLDSNILEQYDHYKINESPSKLSNFLLNIISNTLLTIYDILKKNNITEYHSIMLFFIDNIIKTEKIRSIPDVTKFVIQKYNVEEIDKLETLNESDNDDKFDGYDSPNESIGDLYDTDDKDPDDLFSINQLDIEQNEENIEMNHSMF